MAPLRASNMRVARTAVGCASRRRASRTMGTSGPPLLPHGSARPLAGRQRDQVRMKSARLGRMSVQAWSKTTRAKLRVRHHSTPKNKPAGETIAIEYATAHAAVGAPARPSASWPPRRQSPGACASPKSAAPAGVQLRHFLQPAAEHRLEGEQRHSEDHAGQEIGGARPERAGLDRARPECAKEQRGTRAHRQELHRQRDQLARAAGRHVLAQEGEAPAEDDGGEHRQVEERNGQLHAGSRDPTRGGSAPAGGRQRERREDDAQRGEHEQRLDDRAAREPREECRRRRPGDEVACGAHGGRQIPLPPRNLRSRDRSREAGTAGPPALAGCVVIPTRCPRSSNSGPPQKGGGSARSVCKRGPASSPTPRRSRSTPTTLIESPSTPVASIASPTFGSSAARDAPGRLLASSGSLRTATSRAASPARSRAGRGPTLATRTSISFAGCSPPSRPRRVTVPSPVKTSPSPTSTPEAELTASCTRNPPSVWLATKARARTWTVKAWTRSATAWSSGCCGRGPTTAARAAPTDRTAEANTQAAGPNETIRRMRSSARRRRVCESVVATALRSCLRLCGHLPAHSGASRMRSSWKGFGALSRLRRALGSTARGREQRAAREGRPGGPRE